MVAGAVSAPVSAPSVRVPWSVGRALLSSSGRLCRPRGSPSAGTAGPTSPGCRAPGAPGCPQPVRPKSSAGHGLWTTRGTRRVGCRGDWVRSAHGPRAGIGFVRRPDRRPGLGSFGARAAGWDWVRSAHGPRAGIGFVRRTDAPGCPQPVRPGPSPGHGLRTTRGTPAQKPCFLALKEERSLPSAVLGPPPRFVLPLVLLAMTGSRRLSRVAPGLRHLGMRFDGIGRGGADARPRPR
jgi:hypothetical protein